VRALISVVAGFLLGLLLATWWRIRRLRVFPPPAGAEGPPLLEWILRANGAQGVWLVGPGTREVAAPREGVPEETDRLVRARLEHQRLGDGQGVERMGSGTLVYASLDGRAAGLQLPLDSSTGARATALRDLARLLDYDRWRPVLADVAKQQETPGESVDSVALRLAHQVERILGVEACVAIPRAPGGVVEVVGVSLRSDRRLLGAVVEQGGALEQVALGQSPAQVGVAAPLGNAVSDRRHHADPAFVSPIAGFLGPVGAIAIWTRGGAEPAGAVLAAFRGAIDAAGPRLAAALERQDLADAAIRDPLTGLFNRRGLQEVMSSVSTPSGALVYADLDRFKALNDRLGHPAGDAALAHFARILLQAVRDEDAVARIGGEEFALWLPGAPLERGRQVAERIRQALTWSDWRWQGEKWPLSASFGVAACPETTATRAGLAAQADAALYEAKRGGRDRVELAPPPRGPMLPQSEGS